MYILPFNEPPGLEQCLAHCCLDLHCTEPNVVLRRTKGSLLYFTWKFY